MSENLMEGLLSEISRVKEIIVEYREPSLRGAGNFAALVMEESIKSAEKSISNGDVVEMVTSYKELKEWKC